MAALNASEPSSQSGDVCVRLLLSGFTSATSQLPAEMLSTAVRHVFFFLFFFLSAYFRCICVFFPPAFVNSSHCVVESLGCGDFFFFFAQLDSIKDSKITFLQIFLTKIVFE